MQTCDICGKKTLLPETIGSSLICKKCFVKINGPVWKYINYDKQTTIEKQRENTITKAKSLGYSDNIIKSLNEYFDSVTETMAKCDSCGQVVQKLQNLGHTSLCKKCFSKINSSEWREKEYEDNKSVEENRKITLKKAKSMNMKDAIIKDINAHYDKYVRKGLYRELDGYLGQKLIVFDTYCVLQTTNDFSKTSVKERYTKYIRKVAHKAKNPEFKPDDIIKGLAYGLLSRNIIGAGITLAASAITSQFDNPEEIEVKDFDVKKGKRKLKYEDFQVVDHYRLLEVDGDEYLGFYSFRDDDDEVLFFFRLNIDDKVDDTYSYIKKQMKIYAKKPIQQTNYQALSPADEIKKFKELLDTGAITEKEYNAKKKQLLNL